MSKSVHLLDRHGRPLRSSASTNHPGAGVWLKGHHGGAGYNRTNTQDWHARPIAGADEGRYARTNLTARARDLTRNNGVAKSGSRKARAQTVGTGLRLRSKPNARALGVSMQDATSFGRLMEGEFNRWANDKACDIRQRTNFGGLQRIFWSERFVAGENLGVLRWRPNRGTRYATCLQIVDPDRLSNPHERPDEEFLRQGVELNEDGAPIGYHIRDRHPYDHVPGRSRYTWTRLPRKDEFGNRVVIHGFDDDRSEQTRGVSVFAPIMTDLRDVLRLKDAEIGAATVNAIFAGVVKSSSDPQLLAEALGVDNGGPSGMLSDWVSMRDAAYPEDFGVGNNRFAFLAPGDELDIPDTSRNTTPFGSFKKAFLQEIAGALGLAYPVLADDWEGVNYSSARAALAEVWRLVSEDRASFVSDTIDPIYCAVITEAFDRGYLVEPEGWPSFYDHPEAYLKSYWTGPAKGYVDPLKEAQGGELRLQMNADTLENICAEQGLDWEEVIEQRAIEQQARQALGLQPLNIADVMGGGAASPGYQTDQLSGT